MNGLTGSESNEVPDRPSQAASEFAEPPLDEIPGLSRAHVAVLEAGGADELWVAAGMKHVILRTIGRRSGQEHKVALPFWADVDGTRIVVASFAGAPQHPAWYLNICDPEANPEVLVRVQEGAYWASAASLEGEAYDRTWAALTADRPFYLKYQTRTERRIPLVRLLELRPA
jgi:deazaflavin-dependent oxidoreductase (nitroreductase family)